MASIDKRPLKAFVRYDGNHRIVSGSLILRRNMPKVGRWLEIPAFQCCNPTTSTTTICVNLGILLTTIPFASSYTTTRGESISFIDDGEGTCSAITIIEEQGGEFEYFNVDVYVYNDSNYYYLEGTCTPLPTGFYALESEGFYGVHVTDGVIDQYNICLV